MSHFLNRTGEVHYGLRRFRFYITRYRERYRTGVYPVKEITLFLVQIFFKSPDPVMSAFTTGFPWYQTSPLPEI